MNKSAYIYICIYIYVYTIANIYIYLFTHTKCLYMGQSKREISNILKVFLRRTTSACCHTSWVLWCFQDFPPAMTSVAQLLSGHMISRTLKGTGHPLAQRLGFNDFINLGLTFTAISGVLSRRVWSLNVHLEGSPCGFVAYQHDQLLNQPINQLHKPWTNSIHNVNTVTKTNAKKVNCYNFSRVLLFHFWGDGYVYTPLMYIYIYIL